MDFSAFYLLVVSLFHCCMVCLSVSVIRYENLILLEDFYLIQKNANLHQETVVPLHGDEKESICKDVLNSQVFKDLNIYYLDRRMDETKNFVAAYKEGKEFNRHFYLDNNNRVLVNYRNFLDLKVKIYRSTGPKSSEICYLCMGYTTTENGEILLREFYVFHAHLVDSYFFSIWRESHTLQLFAFIELTPKRLNLNQQEAEEYYDITRFNFETDVLIFNTDKTDILKYLSKNDRGRLCLSVFNTPFYESVGIKFENNGEDTNNLYEIMEVPFSKIQPSRRWSTKYVTCNTFMNQKPIIYRLSGNFKLHNSVIVHNSYFGIESIMTDIPILSNIALTRTAIELDNKSVGSRILLNNLLNSSQIPPREMSSTRNELMKKSSINSSLTPIERYRLMNQSSQNELAQEPQINSSLTPIERYRLMNQSSQNELAQEPQINSSLTQIERYRLMNQSSQNELAQEPQINSSLTPIERYRLMNQSSQNELAQEPQINSSLTPIERYRLMNQSSQNELAQEPQINSSLTPIERYRLMNQSSQNELAQEPQINSSLTPIERYRLMNQSSQNELAQEPQINSSLTPIERYRLMNQSSRNELAKKPQVNSSLTPIERYRLNQSSQNEILQIPQTSSSLIPKQKLETYTVSSQPSVPSESSIQTRSFS
ncbi:hypothetical protein PGB90_009655 [Kerria lacca]